MPTVAELFDAHPATEIKQPRKEFFDVIAEISVQKIEQRRKEIFDVIAEDFAKELAPADERKWEPDWNYTAEGVPVKVYILAADTEWLGAPETLLDLRTHLGFAPERNDVNLNVEMKKVNRFELYMATLTLIKIIE